MSNEMLCGECWILDGNPICRCKPDSLEPLVVHGDRSSWQLDPDGITVFKFAEGTSVENQLVVGMEVGGKVVKDES
jgi:hypothetical protein